MSNRVSAERTWTSVTDETGTLRAAIREILFPSDLSPASDSALSHARFLAEQFGAHLTLYHDIDVAADAAATDWGTEHEVCRRMAAAARAHLERRAAELSVPFDVVVERKARAHEALAALIDELRPDLTVMATHGRSGLAHFFLGSVTERIVQRGRSAVLCVREPEHGVALPYRRILVPTDLSEASRRAFPLAALLALRFSAEVLAVHVAKRPVVASLTGIPDIVEAQLPHESAVRSFLRPELDPVRPAVRIQMGSPWERILEMAWSERADLIVMATRGHDSLSDRVLGSQTERVVRSAPCPVLVAR